MSCPYNIQVNTIAPGPIRHQDDGFPLGASPTGRSQKVKAAVEKMLPSGRLGHPDEIAGAALYLASAASNYTTGAEIIIDGGLLLGNHLSG